MYRLLRPQSILELSVSVQTLNKLISFLLASTGGTDQLEKRTRSDIISHLFPTVFRIVGNTITCTTKYSFSTFLYCRHYQTIIQVVLFIILDKQYLIPLVCTLSKRTCMCLCYGQSLMFGQFPYWPTTSHVGRQLWLCYFGRPFREMGKFVTKIRCGNAEPFN